MPAASQLPVVNRLIDRLSGQDRGRLVRGCSPVDLVFGTMLCEPGRPFRYVYFPLSGWISLVASVGSHKPLEMGLIGNEGMLGATLGLDIDDAPLRGIVQGSGTALRMDAARFKRELRRSPAMRRALNHYLYVLMAQLSQAAGCTRFHEVEARLARWLLLTHDRAHADHFHLTHGFLADMLGVRRSGVTIAAGALQRQKLIHYTRGEITIVNRRGLEAASCECYAAAIKDNARLKYQGKPAGQARRRNAI